MTQLPPAPAAAQTLTPARLTFSADGTALSEDYGDVYHTRHGGLGQAKHVFLAGNELPQRWRQRDCFVILETGFGTGLNFLATWAAWQADAQRSARLHFISCEKHPLRRSDLLAFWAIHAATPAAGALHALAAQLAARWPDLLPGFHRLHFAEERVTLTLLFGDAAHTLPQLRARVDALYLDGFSPACNPELWTTGHLGQLTRLAAADATLATWSVAGSVRDALARLGWQLDKAPGYAGKREMLRGRRGGAAPEAETASPARRAIVIGAGLAGSSAAERLAARGWQIELIDRAATPGQGASGNRAGVLRPLPSLDDNRLARLTRAAFLYTRRHLTQLASEGGRVHWGQTGVLHLARDPAHETTQKRTVETLHPPADYLRFVDNDAAAQLAGWPVANGGWWFAGGAWVEPPSLCRANLARRSANIHAHFRTHAARIEHACGAWQVFDENDRLVASAPTLILANATDARRFLPARWLPLRAARGQVSHLPASAPAAPGIVVCRLGYVTPAIDGVRSAGATFLVEDDAQKYNEDKPELRPAEHAENLAKLNFILPGYASGLDCAGLDGRVGWRAISPDRLPMIGQLADAAAIDPTHPSRPLAEMPRLAGLYLIDGFGARGLVWSALAGELLACHITGEPLPLEADLAEALDPGRFLLRGKRRQSLARAQQTS